jgi:hypothetical protein
MSKKMTPEEVLNSVVEGINTGNLDSLMMLYETDACFASQPGQLAKSPETIRQSLLLHRILPLRRVSPIRRKAQFVWKS